MLVNDERYVTKRRRRGWWRGVYALRMARRYPRDWQKRRLLVLARDGYRCAIRGGNCTRVATEVDHIIPIKDGGGHELSNLRAACVPCNHGRHPRRNQLLIR